MSQHEEHLLRMEKEKRRQEYEIRQQTEELRRKDVEAKKKEMELNRRKEERQRAEQAAAKKAQEDKELERQAVAMAIPEMAAQKKVQEEERQKQALFEAKKREELEKKRLFEERQRAELAAQEEQRQRQALLEARKREELEKQRLFEERQKAELAAAQKKAQEEERLKALEARKQEESERQIRYEEQLKQKHMEKERRKEQKLLNKKSRLDYKHFRWNKDKSESISNNKPSKISNTITNHALEKERKALEREKRRQAEAIGKEVKMKQERDSRREARFNSQERQEIPRPITPINVKTGHVSIRRQFYNERSKSVDRNEETEPRQQRCHMQKDWNRVHPHGAQEESDPPSRPSSSLDNPWVQFKHSVDTWNHSGQEADIVRPSSRIRSTSHHRDWKPVGSERPITPTRFESVSTHQVQDTIKDWGHVVHTEDHSGRSTPVPSRVIGETFADSKKNSGEEAPWRAPQKTLVNISVTRNVAKEKIKMSVEKSHEIYHYRATRSSTSNSESRSFKWSLRGDIIELPLPIATADSWFSREGKGIVSQNSSASTLAHLEGLKSPTETGKTPLPVLAGCNKTTSSSTVPDVQKYENDVDKRTRELEELRSMRADRNKRLQDAFELGDPYPDTEDSVVSYSEDGYSEEEESQRGPSKPAPSRRIGNLFGRSSDQWNEESSGPAPPKGIPAGSL
ncbi:Uncharacterized protein FKW44_023678 [Caligus rogercresseyi]|uniref:Uncharacterized protein n=1 Tax=Caligus rogercresseyi TaxID=217165 RepID=A0A7T8GPV8_CALRO|nr:Uncharacterized protein FKW44_023678 [Caligus rogercresseyi]